MAEANTPTVIAGVSLFLYDQVDYEALRGFLYQPDLMRSERLAEAWIDKLFSWGYFDGAARTGLIMFDTPANNRVLEGVIKPRMKAHGLELTDVAKATPLTGVSDLGTFGQQMASTVLKFRTQGIDHVMFYATIGLGPFLFGPQADAQRYYPRYGLTTMDQPQVLVTSGVSPDQLRRAMSIGWRPAEDVNTPQDPGGNATTDLCASIYKDAGVQLASRADEDWAMSQCAAVLFLQTTLNRTDPSMLNPTGILSAVEQLGGSYRAAGTLGTSFGPGRYDGPDTVRQVAFRDDCDCFVYAGPSEAVR
jgi:hypothetical protein